MGPVTLANGSVVDSLGADLAEGLEKLKLDANAVVKSNSMPKGRSPRWNLGAAIMARSPRKEIHQF